ncbi:ankyrin repeat domain-containing protein 10-like isoform X3 [Portunus trituberculatus]|uniref:ankyrin repeat domain-containing protein 10-like isoform X3 n=1 Tax=Portunus trituberculatus TaxID=210409 RepID=UPI001E1CC790|nr:ankyrin repeat domain-containing protein 10-like isoform X3 [Portunus trituberculatus]XP_045110083.1 ankyrin repeat domain-containing protein 10-like isoform X3 [Portunus trituberculatus]
MATEENKTHSGNWSVMSETALAKNFPLHRACRDGDVAALAALLQQDATHRHLTLEDTYYGWTPTHWAAYFGKLECLKVLVESSGSMHAGMTTSRFTQTPAHIAAFAGHPHCLMWLLQTGLNVNTQDYLGETSLHKAARTGSMECVTVLLGSKVLIGILNNNGQTAAQLANACGYSDLANYLLQAEGKQANGEHNGFISCSVPSHGLNGGVFPHSTEMGQLNGTHKADTPNNGFISASNHMSTNSSVTGSNSTFTSSNGYYGFQPTNNPANESMNGHGNIASKSHNQESEDCEMETDANPVDSQNGKDNTMEPVLNNYMKSSSQNGFCNGNIPKAMSTYTNGSKQNGSREVANGHRAKIGFVSVSPVNQTSFVHKTLPPMEQDITLNDGVSKNYIPIAGCKRSREDVYVPEMKRMKTDEHTVGWTAQATPQETVVVGGDNCRSNNVTHEGALSHMTAPLEEPAPGPAQPPVSLNAQARAREQQRWIWVV